MDVSKLVIYTTTQTHSLGAKAALILGLRTRALHVTEEGRFGLRGATLRTALEEDKKSGLHPFVLGLHLLCKVLLMTKLKHQFAQSLRSGQHPLVPWII